MKAPYFIEILARNGDVLHRHKVAALPIRLGRSYDNDIILDDAHSAAAHAIVDANEQGELVLRDLGVAFGQGYHLGRPNAMPARALPAEVVQALGRNGVAVYPQRSSLEKNGASIRKLLHRVASISTEKNNNEVYEIFQREPKLQIIPVVDDGAPQGLINRFDMIEHFARPYERELYGKKSCTQFMDRKPLIADRNTSLQQLSYRMAAADAHHLFNGFIITEHGRYVGMGTGHDLMREITQMQINQPRPAPG